MNIKTINFVDDFTDCPGGRFRDSGEKSGEEFRDDILIPALDSNDLVRLNLDGAFGFASSFLDEVFGKIVDRKGADWIKKRLEINLTDDPTTLREIEDIIKAHSS